MYKFEADILLEKSYLAKEDTKSLQTNQLNVLTKINKFLSFVISSENFNFFPSPFSTLASNKLGFTCSIVFARSTLIY
jgi:hypothetical protein